MHAGMNFITGAIQEPGVNKHHATFGGTNTFFEVYRGATLLVHDAYLYSMAIKAEGIFDGVK